MPDKNKKNNKYKNYWLQLGIKMFVETTGWIAVPVLGALFLGRWLDTKQNTAPLFFLSLTILAFAISSVGIGITGVKYMKIIDNDEKYKNDKVQKSQKNVKYSAMEDKKILKQKSIKK